MKQQPQVIYVVNKNMGLSWAEKFILMFLVLGAGSAYALYVLVQIAEAAFGIKF